MTPNDWAQLNLRLDEQFRHIHERLESLQSSLHAMDCTLARRLNAHDAYHQTNEHHWGPERLAQRHPFKTALFAMLLLSFLLLRKADAAQWIEKLVYHFL